MGLRLPVEIGLEDVARPRVPCAAVERFLWQEQMSQKCQDSPNKAYQPGRSEAGLGAPKLEESQFVLRLV